MLENYLIKANRLALKVEKLERNPNNSADGLSSDLDYAKKEMESSVNEAISYITAKNINSDVVKTTEDSIVNALVVSDDENSILEESLKKQNRVTELQKKYDEIFARMTTDGDQTAAAYYAAKAKMDEFKARSDGMPKDEHRALASEFQSIDEEYLAAKRAYVSSSGYVADEVARKQVAMLKAELERAKAESALADSHLAELPLGSPISPRRSGSGAVYRALCKASNANEMVEPPSLVAASNYKNSNSLFAYADELPKKTGKDDVVVVEVVGADESALAVKQAEHVRYQMQDAMNVALSENEKFNLILEEVRFQASLEISKVKTDVDGIRNSALTEVQKMIDELHQLKADASALRREAAQAKKDLEVIKKARTIAIDSAKKSVSAADKVADVSRELYYRNTRNY